MEKIKILEIDDTSHECQSLFEFTSLIKILFKLSEKQKYIENKIDYINNRVNEKETRFNNLEIQVIGESKSEDNKIIKSFQSGPKIVNQKLSSKTENYVNSSKDIHTHNLLNEEKDKEKEAGEEKEENEGDNNTLGNINPDKIKNYLKE